MTATPLLLFLLLDFITPHACRRNELVYRALAFKAVQFGKYKSQSHMDHTCGTYSFDISYLFLRGYIGNTDMRFYRLLRYDLRQGLQRRNYLIATLLFSMRLFAVCRSVQFYCNVESISSRGSIGDYMLCLFRGMAIIQHGSMEEKVSVPIEWLIVCGFCCI